MFALDVAMVLLEQSERDVDDTVDPELAVFLPHRFLVHNIIYNHRNDVSPTVRGHALHCLARCLELGSQNATKCVHELFSNSMYITTVTVQLCMKCLYMSDFYYLVVSDMFEY